MQGKKRRKIAFYSFQQRRKSRYTPVTDKSKLKLLFRTYVNEIFSINSKHSSAGLNVPPAYNGNGSDSDDEDYKIRTALGEKIRSMKEPMTEKEKRIIDYIIAKKSPVYGFMQFSFDKNRNKESGKSGA